MKIITISGYAQHGKDSSASFLKRELEIRGKRVLIIHFADYLKFVVEKYFNWDGKKDEAGRTLLQTFGTDIGRKKNENMWAKVTVEFLKGFSDFFDYVIIPDTRFPSEVEILKENNFSVFTLFIYRIGFDNGLTPEQKEHPSETAMELFVFDATIYVRYGLDELESHIQHFIKYYGL